MRGRAKRTFVPLRHKSDRLGQRRASPVVKSPKEVWVIVYRCPRYLRCRQAEGSEAIAATAQPRHLLGAVQRNK
jgi:hypothetical protein